MGSGLCTGAPPVHPQSVSKFRIGPVRPSTGSPRLGYESLPVSNQFPVLDRRERGMYYSVRSIGYTRSTEEGLHEGGSAPDPFEVLLYARS
jgi:hypothetical protein